MSIQRRNIKKKDRFIWEEDDLEIEDPIGSGQFISLREFNKRIAEEESGEVSEKAMPEKNAEQGHTDR